MMLVDEEPIKEWHECDWSTYFDEKRDTENRAMRSLKTQVNLFRKIGGRTVFTDLEEKVFLLERLYVTMNYPLNTIKYKISEKYNLPVVLVERLLATCTLIMYYREFTGMPPLMVN